ncbi:phage major capsid protein [Rhodobacterales bacterium HKCCE3408]|nr:phage major capsid protein [Rhodobacterales bacterium HKCCE3408]
MEIEEIKRSLAQINERAGIAEEVRADLDDLSKKFEAFELKQARAAARGMPSGEAPATPEQIEHRDLFMRWMKNPHASSIRAELESIESKAADGLTDAAGGVLIPELLSDRILTRIKQVSPMRRLVNAQAIGSSDFKVLRSDNAASSGWVGEGSTRNETDTPGFEGIALSGGTVYALMTATEEIMQDSKYDLQGHLIETIATEMAKTEGVAIISGNGTNKPRGLLNVTPESAEDGASPARTEGALRYLPTGVAGGFGALDTGSPYFNPADVLVDVVYDLKSEHRVGATWCMNSATAAVVRKFRDADGRWLWSDGIAMGQPPSLLGYPVEIAEDWPDIGANAHPIAFGNFGAAYFLGDRSGLRMTLDDNITTPGKIRWYVRKRVFGAVVDDEAVRVIKCATS